MDRTLTNRTGEKHTTKQGYTIEIIEYISYRNCTIKFDNGVILKNRRYGRISEGSVDNPYHPTVSGVGYIGEGKYNCKDLYGKLTKEYNTWIGILERCYSKKFALTHPSYKGCTCITEWYNFQVFAEWFDQNFNSECMQKWALDKDILVKNNKIYSPETCVFVPKEINSIFKSSKSYRGNYPIGVLKCYNKYRTGLNRGNKHEHLGTFETIEEAFQAYKTAKEAYIKEVADLWKNKISDKVYQALVNYQVEITD